MLAYNLIFFLLITLAIAEKKNLLGNRLVPVLISFIFILLFTGLRGDVGQDIPNYKEMYLNYSYYSDHLELGFYYLILISHFFNLNFTFFIFFSTILFLAFYYYGLYKLLGTGYIIFAFLFIFCDLYMYFNMSGIRQGIALSIVLTSGYFAYRKKTFNFIALILLAALFHKSSIIALLIYPIARLKIKYNFKFYFIISLAIFIWILFIPSIIKNSTLLSDIRGSAMYLSESYNEFSVNSYLIGLMRRIYPIILFIIFFKSINKNTITITMFNIYQFGFLIYTINYPFFQDISVRISSYFLIFEPVLVISIISSIVKNSNRLAIISMITILMYSKLITYSNIPVYKYVFFDSIF
ncbi:EpsG family protein [Providencia rettgeri]|uniref:EpsG family protein n=1 Tax=Providencia sp. PROV137 TaxID=2949847 RepID=UPI00259F7D2C|nr:EpsG family protein [Providencia rettgeri]ELR5284247.1 EpsG family protein [Providencia rettgeri]